MSPCDTTNLLIHRTDLNPPAIKHEEKEREREKNRHPSRLFIYLYAPPPTAGVAEVDPAFPPGAKEKNRAPAGDVPCSSKSQPLSLASLRSTVDLRKN